MTILEKYVKAGCKDLISFVLGVGTPLLIVLFWHFQNQLYPAHDAADYFRSALNNYLIWEDKGFISGLIDTYLNRGWRPIFFSAFIVPFIVATNGNFLASVTLTLSVTYFLLLSTIYLIGRQYVSPYRAAIITTLVGTLAWVLRSALYINSEVFLFMLVAMTLLFAIKCNYFQHRGFTILFGLSVGLCLITKPAPFIMSMFLPLIALGIRAHILGHITWKQILTIIFILVISGLFIYLPSLGNKGIVDFRLSLLFIIGYVVVVWVALILFWRSELAAPITKAAFTCGLVMVIWWVPYFQAYLDYVFTGGLGAMAKLYHLTPRNFLSTINHFFSVRGGWPLLLSSCIAIVAIALNRDDTQGKSLVLKTIGRLAMYFLIVLSSFFIPMFLTSISPGADPRRAEVSFFVLLIAALIFSMRCPGRLGVIFALLLLVFTGTQAWQSFSAVANIDYPNRAIIQRYFPDPPKPYLQQDPSKQVFNILSELGLHKGSVATFTFVLDLVAGYTMRQSFEVGMLQALAFKNKLELYFGYPWEFYNLEEGYKKLQVYDYVLLDVGNYPVGKFSDGPYSILTFELINRWRSKTLAEVGLAPEISFSVNDVQIVLLRNASKSLTPTNADVVKPTIFGDQDLAYKHVTSHATDYLPGFPPSHLADGNLSTTWGSAETNKDTIFYVKSKSLMHPQFIRLSTAASPSGSHLKEVSIVGIEQSSDGELIWEILDAKFPEQDFYSKKLIVPDVPNETLIEIQIDPLSLPKQGFTAVGVACFSESFGYERNHQTGPGKGIYIRELTVYR